MLLEPLLLKEQVLDRQVLDLVRQEQALEPALARQETAQAAEEQLDKVVSLRFKILRLFLINSNLKSICTRWIGRTDCTHRRNAILWIRWSVYTIVTYWKYSNSVTGGNKTTFKYLVLQYSAALFAGDGSVIEGSGSSAGDGMFNSGQFGKMCEMLSCKKYICIIFVYQEVLV